MADPTPPPQVVIIGVDIETSGSIPGSDRVLSVGAGVVFPNNTFESRLFTFSRPKFPETKWGPVIVPVPLSKEQADGPDTMVMDDDGKPKWTGAFLNWADHPITEYNDFEPRCWNEFWSKHIDTLIDNLSWEPREPKDEMVWYDFRMYIDDVCMRIVNMGMKPRIVSDNQGFDIGRINQALLTMPSGHHPVCKHGDGEFYSVSNNFKMQTLHYLPMEGNMLSMSYRSIRDPSDFTTAVKGGFMPEEKPAIQVKHTHRADQDALSIAACYASYARKYPHLA